MLKKLIFILILSTSSILYAQKYTFYKTGRPQSFEYNNAEKIVAKKWKIEFKYIAFDGKDFALLDSINELNTQTSKELESKKGLKWEDEFLMDLNQILLKTNKLRELIGKEIITLNNGSEKFIHFEPHFCKNQYKAFVVAQVQEKKERKFYVLQIYYVNLKRETFKLKEEKQRPLHFSYPENGIE